MRNASVALGVLFALGTCYVLFNDVHSLSQVTVDHVMTLLVLIGTVASGHMVTHQRRTPPVVGLGLLFAAGTFYCVTQSAARNAEGRSKTNGRRQRQRASAGSWNATSPRRGRTRVRRRW